MRGVCDRIVLEVGAYTRKGHMSYIRRKSISETLGDALNTKHRTCRWLRVVVSDIVFAYGVARKTRTMVTARRRTEAIRERRLFAFLHRWYREHQPNPQHGVFSTSSSSSARRGYPFYNPSFLRLLFPQLSDFSFARQRWQRSTLVILFSLAPSPERPPLQVASLP